MGARLATVDENAAHMFPPGEGHQFAQHLTASVQIDLTSHVCFHEIPNWNHADITCHLPPATAPAQIVFTFDRRDRESKSSATKDQGPLLSQTAACQTLSEPGGFEQRGVLSRIRRTDRGALLVSVPTSPLTRAVQPWFGETNRVVREVRDITGAPKGKNLPLQFEPYNVRRYNDACPLITRVFPCGAGHVPRCRLVNNIVE
jgi:hypothetical protein